MRACFWRAKLTQGAPYGKLLSMARANHRSPNYPRLAFDTALEKARIVYDRHQKHSVSREAIAQALGYTTFNNGASKAVIAALKYYGLLEPAGDGLCVSSDAVRALELPQIGGSFGTSGARTGMTRGIACSQRERALCWLT
jgi:hypothetical protein